MLDQRDNPLTPQAAPDLEPLRLSHEVDEFEAEVKALFLGLIQQHARPGLNDANTLGMPQMGSAEQFARAVKHDGLALYRSADDEAMRYVYEAWRGRNPKRGLAMLRTYLQLLWPNAWQMWQLWHDKSKPYPTGLSITDNGNHWLTSRVDVELDPAKVDDGYVTRIIPALRSVVPARILLNIRVMRTMEMRVGIAAAYRGMVWGEFSGVATAAPTYVETPAAVTAYTSPAGLVAASRGMVWGGFDAVATASPSPVPALDGTWTYSDGDDFSAWDASRYKVGQWYGDKNDDGTVNFDVAGGALRIFPQRNKTTGLLINRTITTEGTWLSPTDRAYYVEVRFKLKPGAGRFPGVWLQNHFQNQVPSRPELDIMETGTGPWWGDGTVPVRLKSTTWTDDGITSGQPQPNNQTSQGLEYLVPGGLVNVWHTCGAMVDPVAKTVTYFIDRVRIGQHSSPSAGKPMYLSLDEWFDGGFNTGTPADPVALEAAADPIEFDYWRAWVAAS